MTSNIVTRVNNTLSVVIQAGGKSSRMGEIKMLMPFLGKPLIQRVMQRVETIAQELIIVTNDPDSLAFLNVDLVEDSFPGKGAIGGLYTAMDKASCEYVAVVACDMPFVNSNILLAGYKLLKKSGADVAIPKLDDGYFEPLHAVYRRNPCKAAILQSIEQNKQRLISWMSFVNVIEMDPELCGKLDPDGTAFININTREDFLQAETIGRGELK
jgi:molybdopterin-guanine dinucleotide biosynthesis protein A